MNPEAVEDREVMIEEGTEEEVNSEVEEEAGLIEEDVVARNVEEETLEVAISNLNTHHTCHPHIITQNTASHHLGSNRLQTNLHIKIKTKIEEMIETISETKNFNTLLA